MQDANFLMAFVLVFIVGFLFGCIHGLYSTNKDWRNNAVKAGHAEWITGEDGSAVWRWKEND